MSDIAVDSDSIDWPTADRAGFRFRGKRRRGRCAQVIEHVHLQLQSFEALDWLSLGLGDVAKDHVRASIDLHAL